MIYHHHDATIEDLLGKTIKDITRLREGDGNDEGDVLFFITEDAIFRMYHSQDCCEDVHIDDICGDLHDLLDTPITMAQEISNSEEQEDFESHTWTFYKLGTNKGDVTIRWYGSSNGYYSESVDFVKMVEQV